MNQLYLITILAGICMVLPIWLLIILVPIGPLIADTRLVPYQMIYYVRFVPMGVLSIRGLLTFAIAKRSLKTLPTAVFLWLPFLTYAGLSCVYSLEPVVSAQRWLSGLFGIFGVAMALTLFIPQHRSQERVFRAMAIVLGLSAIYSLFTGVMPEGVEQTVMVSTDFERLRGTFKNPNALGLIAMQVAIILRYWADCEKRPAHAKILTILFFLIGFTALLSGSRASVLGLFVGLFVYFRLKYKIKGSTLPAIWNFVFLISVLVLSVFMFFPEFFEGLLRVDSSGRLEMWKATWELALRSPMYGVGFGGSDGLFAMYSYYMNVLMGTYFSGPHNSFLHLMVDVGIIGLVLAMVPFFLVIRKALRTVVRYANPLFGAALLGVVAASLSNAFFESWLFGFGSGSTMPFWIALLMLSHLNDGVAVKKRIGMPLRAYRSNPKYLLPKPLRHTK